MVKSKRYEERKSPLAFKFFNDGPDGVTVRPIVVVPVPVARIEVQVSTVSRTVGRCGPIVTVRPNVGCSTRAVVTTTGGRKTCGLLIEWVAGRHIYQTANRHDNEVVLMIYPFLGTPDWLTITQ